jgi:hypothetical protein
MLAREIKKEIQDVMTKSHGVKVKVKWIDRWRRVTYPTGRGGYVGKILVTGPLYKPTIFNVDKTDGFRLQWISYAH